MYSLLIQTITLIITFAFAHPDSWDEKLTGFIFLFCAKYGHLDIVQLLLEKNSIDVNYKDKYGRTALLRASKNGNLDIVNYLLQYENIDLYIQTGYGYTALMYALFQGLL